MKSRKQILFLITIFFIFCLFITPVKAAKYDAYSYYGVPGVCEESYHYCWTGWGTARMLQGIRVTAYDQSGNRVSDTVDFTNDMSVIDFVNSNNYFVADGKSRVDYIKSGNNITPKKGKGNLVYADFENVIKFSQGDGDFSFSLETEAYILEKINYCKRNTGYNCSSSGKYFFVIEPLTIIWSRYDEYDYYGTYYELMNMLKTNSYGTYVGVASFLPSNIGLSIYIQENDRDFTRFYRNVGLEKPDKYRNELNLVKTCSNVANSCNYSLLGNYTRDRLPEAGYGVGVFTISISLEEEEIPDDEIGTCRITSEVDHCNDRIVYEYTNCPLNANSYEIDNAISGNTICQIQCNEKYYVATWNVRDTFTPINRDGTTGILAGSYFSLNAPTVYHKKTCQYVENISSFEAKVEQKKRTVCKPTNFPEPCPTEQEPDKICFDEIKAQECIDYWDAYKQNKKASCSSLNAYFNRMDSARDARDDASQQKNITLNSGFKNYALEPTLTETLVDVDGYDYGYKNTFVYGLSGTVNQYIGMDTIHSASSGETVALDKNYDNGQPMITTPINSGNISTEYSINYTQTFSSNFKNIITNSRNSGYIRTNSFNHINNVCPYDIISRNISNKCIPTSSNNYCGDPDYDFISANIRMTYRPISLSVPFPGKNYIGIQRQVGRNWNEETINLYITNNRGVKDEEVYRKDPIYVIDLDSTKIKAIREYNDTHAYDDFTLSCTAGAGTECISNFLRDYNLFSKETACSKIETPDNSGIPNLEFYNCTN